MKTSENNEIIGHVQLHRRKKDKATFTNHKFTIATVCLRHLYCIISFDNLE